MDIPKSLSPTNLAVKLAAFAALFKAGAADDIQEHLSSNNDSGTRAPGTFAKRKANRRRRNRNARTQRQRQRRR